VARLGYDLRGKTLVFFCGGGGGGGGGGGNFAKLKRFGGVFLDFQSTASMYRLGLE